MIYYSYIINLRGEAVDQSLIHSIESVVIDWTHQIHDIIKKDSARPILDGLDPHPMFEVEFWISKYNNLDNIFEQVYENVKLCKQKIN